MDISKRVSELRFQKGIKQKDIAIILDIPQSTYSRMENNADKLTIEQLEKIAGALGVGLLELLTGEPPVSADAGRVKELEARVLELEDRINDKAGIINQMKNDVFNLCYAINQECQDQIIRCALANGILDKNIKSEYIKIVEEDSMYDEEENMIYWYWKKSKLRSKHFLPLDFIMTQDEISNSFDTLNFTKGVSAVFLCFFHYCKYDNYEKCFDTSIMNILRGKDFTKD